MRHALRTILAVTLFSPHLVAGPIEFVVAGIPGQSDHEDSYVIAIDSEDTERINHARALIDWVAAGAEPNDSPGATIVLANIESGSDGINRNYLAENQPFWSWHATQPIEFVDHSIEILDGWPTFVEQDVPGWVANTNGAIGFWSYTVVRELNPVPEPSGLALVVGLLPLRVVMPLGRQPA